MQYIESQMQKCDGCFSYQSQRANLAQKLSNIALLSISLVAQPVLRFVFERAKGGQECKRMRPMSRFVAAKPRPWMCGPKKRPEARKCRCLTVKVRPTLRRAGESINYKERARQHIFDKDGEREWEKGLTRAMPLPNISDTERLGELIFIFFNNGTGRRPTHREREKYLVPRGSGSAARWNFGRARRIT